MRHRHVASTETPAHRAYALAKGSRERVENIHSWIEPLSESLIAALRFIQLSGFRFKYGEDGFGRSAALYFRSEWVGSQVFPGLLLILLEGLYEDELKR